MSFPKSANENVEGFTIKRSTYGSLIVGIIIAVAAATFFAGFLLGNSTSQINSDFITKSDLENTIAKLESKLDNIKVTAPAAQPSAQPSVQAPTPIFKISLGDDPVKGNPNAPITIIEFSDFQCPFCARFYHDTLPQVDENYINTGKAKLVYRDLPLESLHKNAKSAALAAQCANEQGKFWDFHDKLFGGQSIWQNQSPDDLSSTFMSYVNDLKLDSKKFESCYTSSKYLDKIEKNMADAAKLSTTGTPTFFIGTEKDGFIKLVGAQPFTSFKYTIDPKLG